jgi:hypothetical protein
MVAYTGIQGQNILIVSSDPANPVEGQIWYNSTSNLLKGYANVVTNSFASGGNLNTARYYTAGGGTQTAAIIGGGGTNSGILSNSESYNGTSWTSVSSINTARSSQGGAGTQTAAVIFGGSDPGTTGATELWNGSAWTTNPTAMNTARRGSMGNAGIQTAALAYGGAIPGTSPGFSANSESFNGSTWTNTPSLNTARNELAGCGTQTAAIAFAGSNPAPTAATESWNGSSWTTVNSMNTARFALGGFGTQTAAVGAGGFPVVTTTELYNGTTWTSNPTGLGTAVSSTFGVGFQPLGLIIGGYNGTIQTATTQEWTGTVLATRTITTS